MANEAIRLANELDIQFRIVPKSPLLIVKNNVEGNVITWLLNDDDKPYIPGSTLKGLFREQFTTIYYDYLGKDSEKLEKSAEHENIFDGHQEIMEKAVNSNEIKREEVYENSLEVEKLFGSKVLRGRFWTGDAKFVGKYDIENRKFRSITPIDRFTGGAVVPLNFEYVEEDFTFNMKIKNITKEELRILIFIIRDSQNGEIRIGNSKTRGFGEIELKIDGLEIKEYSNHDNIINIKEFGTVVEDNSIKIGEKYLVKSSRLKDEFLMITKDNKFVQEIMRGEN